MPLPFVLTGGALVAYGSVMTLFSVYWVYALFAFSPLLLAGAALLFLGPAVVRRSEKAAGEDSGHAQVCR